MLEDAAFYISLSGIIIAVIFQSAFFIRFKFKVDISAILILLVYLAVFIARAFFNKKEYSGIGNVQPICVTLIWGVLLYYLFEMAYIKAAIISYHPEQHRKKKIFIKISKTLMFMLLFGCFLPTNLIIFN